MSMKFTQKKIYLATALLTTLLCGSAFAVDSKNLTADEQQAVKNLHDQVGKNPSDVQFFQNAIIKKRLAEILPDSEKKLIKNFTVETPIALMKDNDNVLSVNVCKPHDCGDNNATVYFDFNTTNLVAYFVETNKSGRQMKWFTPKKACNLTEKNSASAIAKDSQTAATLKKINACLGIDIG
ncbi:MAG: Ivy family c-type lysozyme inhibitor [Gammaproteobacteria bacterium]